MILASAPSVMTPVALGAAVAYAASAAAQMRPVLARKVVWLAWVLHGVVLVSGLLGEQPRFGFAHALSVTAWLVGLVYAVESRVFPQLRTHWVLAALGSVTVLLALVFPGSPLHFSASGWLPLHWALGIASYGLFAVAVVHAALMTRAEARIRSASDAEAGLPLLTLERLTFRFVGVGYVLLSATLLAGFFFGNHLYGPNHSVSWNHKTAFSVLAWLTFSVLLIGRARFGWRGRRAVRVLYTGTGLLLLAYVGSRFVLEVILGRSA